MLLALLVYRPAQQSRAMRVTLTVLTVGAAAALFFAGAYAPTLSTSLVSDAPELGFAFLPAPWAFWLLVLLAMAQVYAIWHGRTALLVVIACCCIGSQWYVRQAQGHLFRGPYTDGRDAVLAQQMLGADAMQSTVVLARSRDDLSKFGFHLGVVPLMRLQAPDSAAVARTAADYAWARAYIVLADQVQAPPGLACTKLGEHMVYCVKAP